MKATTIYICTHKDFTPLVESDTYKVLKSDSLTPYMGLDDRFWSELIHFFHVCDNCQLPDYIGFCHYRRYYSFLDKVPNFEKVLDENDCIAAKPLEFGCSVRQQYAHCHNIKDLELIEDIIRTKYPSYIDGMETFLDGNTFFPYNMVIMKRKNFKEYVKFVKGVMTEYLSTVGTDIYKRIEDNKGDYIKDFHPNNSADYQYRIGGFLSERLTNIYLFSKFNRIKTYNVIITENKY